MSLFGLGMVIAVIGTAVVVTLIRGDGDGGAEADQPSPRDRLVMGISDYVYGLGLGTINRGDADCIADRIVDTVGVDRLTELDILGNLDRPDPPPLLANEEAQVAYREGFSCLDDAALVPFLARTFRMASDISAPVAECMVQGWFDAVGRDTAISMYTVLATQDPERPPATLPPDQNDVVTRTAATCATQADTSTTTGTG